MDENRHRSNAVSCELARIDTVHHGLADGVTVPTLLMRFNPNVVFGQHLPDLLNRLKVLAQFLRDFIAAFNKNGNLDALPVVTLQYFFYGEDSKHRELAEAAAGGSFILNKDINECLPSGDYDPDIESFTFERLDNGDIEPQLGKEAADKLRLLIRAGGNMKPFCSAVMEQVPCWKTCRPGLDLCNRHCIHEESGKLVMRFTTADQMLVLSHFRHLVLIPHKILLPPRSPFPPPPPTPSFTPHPTHPPHA